MKARDAIELALFYVGIPAITLYPLGFVALAVQIWKDPFFPYYDFTAVWNAVALVPNTVVVGTGLELLYLSSISTILGVGIASLTFTFLRRYSHDSEKRLTGRQRSLWIFYLLVLLPVAAFVAYTNAPVDSWDDVPFVAGFFIFSGGGGALIGYTRVRNIDTLFFTGIAVAYVGAILAALCLATLSEPNLPLMRIDTQLNSPNDCSGASEDTFVVLVEGFNHWYAYNDSGLYAIPYEKVGYARYQDCPSHKPLEDGAASSPP